MPDEDGSLRDARDWLRKRAMEGAHCPCCRQYVKVYRRKLNSGMVRALIGFARFDGWAHWLEATLPVKALAREHSKLRYWGLLEEQPATEGEKTTGTWRVTTAGREFVHNRAHVLSHAVLYDDRLIRLDGEYVSIRDVVGSAFDYDELMRERPESDEPQREDMPNQPQQKGPR